MARGESVIVSEIRLPGWRQPPVVHVIGEVDQHAFGLHPERGGDELGVHRVDQVSEAGYSQPASRRLPDRERGRGRPSTPVSAVPWSLG